MKPLNQLLTLSLLLIASCLYAQDEQGTVIQNLTPSQLIKKGQWDIKFFNNLYTQTESTFTDGNEPRETFFTSTLDVFYGISENRRWNIGTIVEFRSNVNSDRDALDVFSFDGENGTARSGLTSIAPAVKFVPFKNLGNFSILSAFHIPLVDNEVEQGVFLDQNGYILQNRFFYDYSFGQKKWQLFTELNTEFNFGKEEDSFANDSLRLTPGIFLSYFPSSKFTVLGLVQHSQLIDLGNDFSQNFTAVGGGAKYQLTNALNIEILYTNFVRGNDTGLGETFNIGLRAVF